MTRVLDRIRRGRLGPFALVLLVLLVLVVAHALIMGSGHHEDAACGTCVVVIVTGLVAVVALRTSRLVTASASLTVVRVPGPMGLLPALRPPPVRTTVLRI